MGTTVHASGFHTLATAPMESCMHTNQSMVLRRVSGQADVWTLMCTKCSKFMDGTNLVGSTVLVASHGQTGKG